MEAVQDHVSSILWHKRIVSIPSSMREFLPPEILIVNPSLEDKALADYRRRQDVVEAMREGVPAEADVIAEHIEAGYWSDENTKYLEEVDDFIADLEKNKRNERLKVRQKKYDRSIAHAQQTKKSLQEKRDELWRMSAEYLGHESYIFTLTFRTAYNMDGARLWDSEESFLTFKSKRMDVVNFVAAQVIGEGRVDPKIVRDVARSFEWRVIWGGARDSISDLFQCPLSDININQKLLIYWSRVYDSVYEDPDRPDQEIIDDDDRLDDWLQEREEKRKDRHKNDSDVRTSKDHQEQMVMLEGYYSQECTCGASKIKKKGQGERPRHTVDCPWGQFVKYTPAEKEQAARQIYGRNNVHVRKELNRHHDTLENTGRTMREQEVRDQRSRMLLQLPQTKKKIQL